MANYNLTNQEIKDTFQQLAQVSGSGLPDNKNYILDGTGSLKTSLELTASLATSASHAIIADSSISATNADTASFFGEGIVTASAVASTITFTKDNGTTFDITVAQSGSVESASYAAFASNAESASYATSASSALYSVSGSSSLYAVSSSYALDSVSSSAALYSISASAAIRAVSSSHALEADHAAQADDLLINVKNLSGETLAKGTAVHATGVTGENVTVIKADASIAGNMPAVALLNEQLTDNSVGQAIIAGRLIGINTSALLAGEPVYVNTEGNLTSTKPTGSLLIQNIGTAAKINASDGEIIIQGSGRSNDLPNLTSGYAWVGNSDGVPTAVTTSSLLIDSASTATSASHAIQADSASFVNTLNQSVIISGSRLDIEGTNSNEGLYVEGGSVNINEKGTKQYGNVRQYYDTDKWSGNFNGYQLINNSSGSEAFTGLMAISTFTGYDGSNPVFYLQGGGNNGSYQNTILRSSYNKPWVNITKQASFDSAITASAVISASGGIEGDLTGDVVGNISASSGTSNFNNISVSGTGSFGYIESVTGSAKIIGDAFIILNNDTPAQRYAGIKVIDSGAADTTASLQFDGGTNDWFYEYGGDDATDHGVLMFGPEYGTKGSPTYLTSNRIPKGDGGHHLNDSNISDDGSTVSINSTTDITGSVNVSANNITVFNSNNSAIAIGNSTNPQQFAQSRIYNNIDTYDGSLYNAFNLIDDGTATDGWDAGMEVTTFASAYDGNNKVFRLAGGGLTGPNGGYTNNQYILTATTTGGKVYQHKDTEFESNVKFNQAITGSIISASGDISGSRFNATNGFQTDAASALGFISTKAQSAFGNITVDQSTSPFVGLTIGAAAAPTRAPGITMYTSHSQYPAGFNYAGITINDGDNATTFYGNKVNAGGDGAVAPSGQASFAIQAGATADSTTGDNTSFAINNADGFPNFTKTTIFRRPVSASAGISASGDIDLSGNLIVDGASNLNGVSTLSGSVIVTGSVQSEVISGSADGSRNFSLDMEKASMYTCELISGSNVNIQPANIKKGATVMLKTIQPSTSADSYGVLTYENSVKFSGGTSLQPTAASGSVDVFTFVSFDGTTLDATSVTDLK